MKIIDKYVLREHLGPLIFALSALTSLLLLNYIAKRFGALVGKGLSWGVIGEFFLLSIPFVVAMTIPMAVLVSTLYAFSRLASENEVTAFKASGVSVRRLMKPVLWAAAVLAVGMIFFNDQLLPRSNHRLAVLQSDIFRKKPTFGLVEQVTNRVTERIWLRAGHVEHGQGQMRDVVIYDFTDPERPRTVYADSGTMALTEDQSDLALVLFDGVVREFPRGAPGGGSPEGNGGGEGAPPSFQQTFFERQRVLVRGVGNQLQRSEQGEGQQLKSDREQTVCELQSSYTAFVAAYRQAHEELTALARNAAETAKPVEVPPLETTYATSGLGALYCRLLGSLGVQSAHAAEVPVQDSQPEAPPPGTGAGGDPASDPVLRQLSKTGGASPSVMLDAARLRVANNWTQLNKYDVEIQKKFALAVACVVFVLLGAPIALRFPRGGVGLVIGASLGVFAFYYVLLIAGEAAADRGYLPPWAAMWTANILFTLAGLYLLSRVGREGATARGGDLSEIWDSIRGRFAGLGRRRGGVAR